MFNKLSLLYQLIRMKGIQYSLIKAALSEELSPIELVERACPGLSGLFEGRLEVIFLREPRQKFPKGWKRLMKRAGYCVEIKAPRFSYARPFIFYRDRVYQMHRGTSTPNPTITVTVVGKEVVEFFERKIVHAFVKEKGSPGIENYPICDCSASTVVL